MLFPSTPVLDTFNRANESPLDAPWAPAVYWWGTDLDLISNAVANGNVTGPTIFASGSYWTTSLFGPNFEAYVTVTVLPALEGEGFGLNLFISNPANAAGPQSTFDVNFYRELAGTYHLQLLYWIDDVIQGAVIDRTGVSLAANDVLGVRRLESSWVVFQNGSAIGVGTEAGSAVPIYPGLFIDEDTADQLCRLDNFGGGSLAGAHGEVEVVPRRLRRTPTLSHENKWTFYQQLQVDLEAGLGLTTGQGSDPDVMLRWSDDGGHTWSNVHTTKAGKKGQYKHRARWLRLGRARNRIFETTVDDPIAWNLIAAYLKVDGGIS